MNLITLSSCMILSCNAFTSTIPSTPFVTSLSSSRDFISSKAAYGVDRSRDRATDDENPEENLQAYLQPPEPVPSRSSIDGSVLVSGYVTSPDRTDQLVFDFLNSEESAFKFSKIIACVPDVTRAKKRLLSRSARYTGLLDKLDFVACSDKFLPSDASQLEGVKSWVAHIEKSETVDVFSALSEVSALCSKASSLENVSILISNAAGLAVDSSVAAIKALDDQADLKYTITTVGKLESHGEGSKPYKICDFGTEYGVIPSDETAIFSRDESMRLVTECLGLENSARKALTFMETTSDDVAAKLIKGLREAGYSRPQEIDHMITKGVIAYEDAIEEYKQKKYQEANPDPEKTRLLQEERDKQAELDWEKTEAEFEERKKAEIEENAKTWAKREYFRRSMSGNMGMTEEEFTEKNWDRAMFEGDLKYRMMHGGKTDERKELADFMKKQEAKKEAALKKARKALEEKLGVDLADGDSSDDEKDD